MHYEDFSIQLDALGGGEYRARVIASPAGQAQGTFALPLSREELARLAATVGDDVVRRRRARAARTADAGVPVAPAELRDAGARLFRALFPPEVNALFRESLGRIAGRPGVGLRLKLHLVLEDQGSLDLHELPWEFLLRPDSDDFLSLRRDLVLTRYLALPSPADRPPTPLPLRILAVPSSATPPGAQPLDVEREMQALGRAWSALPGVVVERLTPPTLGALRETLLAREFHVLHFMGHGAFDAQGRGLLCFEDGDGRERRVTGRELAQQIRDVKSLRLVVLNACESARSAAAAPFTGAATALMQAGVPAVVAMQFAVSDEAALAFSEMFYRRLAAGDPVDTAVAEARLAVAREIPDTLEWGTPVLFLRAPDGRLFERPASGAARTPEAHRSPSQPETPEVASPALSPPSPRAAWDVRRTLVVTVGLTLALLLWRATGDGPIDKSAATPSPQPTTSAIGTPSPQPSVTAVPTLTHTAVTTPIAPTPKPSLLPAVAPSVTPTPAPTPVTIRPTQSGVLTLRDHESASVPALEAHVSVAFNTLFGQDTLRVTLSAPGVLDPASPPVLGPGPIEFRAERGAWRVDVLDIDWQSRRATLRLRAP